MMTSSMEAQKIKRQVKKTYYEVLKRSTTHYGAIGEALKQVPGYVGINYLLSTTELTVTHYFAKLATPGKTIVITHDYFTERTTFKVQNSDDLFNTQTK